MYVLTLSTKGQLTVPRELRVRLKLHPGCKIQGTIDDQGRLVLVPALHEPEELFRGRPPLTRALTVEDMDRVIARAARARSRH
jgi:bifunctional DNA-binding transcriptional regulator/antitoxin component of YhaV-PrlF toxin-antitoxin module